MPISSPDNTVRTLRSRRRGSLTLCWTAATATDHLVWLQFRRAIGAVQGQTAATGWVLRRGEDVIGQRILRAVLLTGCCALLLACTEQPPPVSPSPPPAIAKPAAAETIHVIVRRGQSLGRIAQSYHVAKQDIISANNLQAPYRLKAGMVLTIRLPVSSAKKIETPPKPHRSAGRTEHPKPKEPEIIPLD
jgi:hypothetical protein